MPGGPRGTNKADAEQTEKKKNYYAALMDDSSSSESESSDESGGPSEEVRAGVPAPASEKLESKAPASPPFRVWVRERQTSAVAAQQTGPGPFKSPFHRHSNRRRQVKKEGEDGWVSLKTYEPPAVADASEGEEKPVILYEPRSPPGPWPSAALTPPHVPAGVAEDEPMEELDLPPPPPQPSFPSLLRRKAVAPPGPVQQPSIVLEDKVSHPSELDQLSALAWAERVRASLEAAERKPSGVSKGEQAPAASAAAGLGRLSFFRRPLVPSAEAEGEAEPNANQ